MGRQLDLTEPRSVWGIVRTALWLYARYPLLFLTLAGAVVVPYELVVLALSGFGPLRQEHIPGSGGWLVLLFGAALVTPLVSALAIHAVRQAGEGERPVLRKVGRRGLRSCPVVAATSIMFFLGTTVGFFLLVIPGVVLALRWAVAAQAAALDNEGWQEALRRSGQLARGSYLHIFGLGLVVSLIALAIWTGPDAIANGHAASAPLVALGIAVQTFLQSFSALAFALLYFDLVARPALAPRRREYQRPRDLDP
jgi:hypothetical protein